MMTLLLSALAAAAQDDVELAGALAERGWWDSSEELFQRAARDPRQAAEGRYGLARLNVLMAERADSPEERLRLGDLALRDLEGFLREFPAFPRRGRVLSDLGQLLQSKGRTLLGAGKVEAAGEAFRSATKLFQDLILQLQKNPSSEEELMFAKYAYGTALFTQGEALRGPEARAPLEASIKFFSEDFLWQYESYLLAYDASIYIGRAFRLLAESAAPEKVETFWKQSFMNFGRVRGLLGDKQARANEGVRDLVARGILQEMKARTAYADTKRGATALREYAAAGRLAEDYFKVLPQARLEEIGKALQLEQARVWCKSGQLAKGLDLLQQLARQHKDSWVENLAIDLLGEYGADRSLALTLDTANNLFSRGKPFLLQALSLYRKVLAAIQKPEDRKFASECTYQIGRCYYYLDRYHESVAALTPFEKAPLAGSPEAPQAALLKLNCLVRLSRLSKDKADEKAFEDFRAWLTRTYPNEAGGSLLRDAAIDAEMKGLWGDAAAKWEQLAKPAGPYHEEALFSLGRCRYRQGAATWDQALDAFRKHLALVATLPAKDARLVKNAVGSILYASTMLAHTSLNKPAEALVFSEGVEQKFPQADPKLLIEILGVRVQARLKLGRIPEAEEELQQLKSRYGREQVGLDAYERALGRLAQALLEQAAKLEDAGERERLNVRAAEYFYDQLQLNPGKPGRQTEGMARMLFVVAEGRMSKAAAAGDKVLIEEARKIYGRSLELSQEVLLAARPEDQPALKSRILRCLLMTGQFQKAVDLAQEATRRDPQMRDGSSWEALADAYLEQSKSLAPGAERTALIRKAGDLFGELASRFTREGLYHEHTWRLLYKQLSCLFETDLDRLQACFSTLKERGYAPKWDADEQGLSRWGYQAKFEELRARLEQRLPGRK